MKRRSHVNKYKSAKHFRGKIGKTKGANIAAVQRGGIRL